MRTCRFIHELSGEEKYIEGESLDYWWTTRSKMERYVSENGFSSDKLHAQQQLQHRGRGRSAGREAGEIPGETGFSAEGMKLEYTRGRSET